MSKIWMNKEKLCSAWKDDEGGKFGIKYRTTTSPDSARTLNFDSEEERDVEFERISGGKSKGGKSMLKELLGDAKGYLRENRDLVWTVVLVILVDQFIFQGAFRERLKKVVEGMLAKAEAKVG